MHSVDARYYQELMTRPSLFATRRHFWVLFGQEWAPLFISASISAEIYALRFRVQPIYC